MKRSFFILLLKAQLATIGFFLIFMLITAAIVGLIVRHKFTQFLQSAGMSTSEVIETVRAARSAYESKDAAYFTVVVLGLDEVENRDQAALSDTLMVLTVNNQSGSIQSLSIPRDYWLDEYQTKVNALYYYSQQKDPSRPVAFFDSVFAETFGIRPDAVVVVKLDQLAELVDIVGGVEIDVPQSFVDEHFPRTGVDPSLETNVAILQETISFSAGPQTMNGDRVLEYVRSRQAEGSAGTDIARTERQQAVLSALMQKLSSKELYTNPELLGQLVAWYRRHYQSQLSTTQLLTEGMYLADQHRLPDITFHSIPIAELGKTNGILFHPPNWQYQNQWVYTATDSAVFRSYLQTTLY